MLEGSGAAPGISRTVPGADSGSDKTTARGGNYHREASGFNGLQVAADPVFVCDTRRHVWRIGPTDYQGRKRLGFWPWYRDTDGKLKPGRGGFFMPLERIPELMDVLRQIDTQHGPPAG